MTMKTSQTIWRLPGLGTREATLVVAASDSSPQSKAQADFVADGVDDQVTIQAAIDALPAGGGKVLLTEGTFNTSATISVKPNVSLTGSGFATIIRLKDGVNPPTFPFTVVRMRSNSSLRNLTVHANMMGQTAESRGRMTAVSTYALQENIVIEGNRFQDAYTNIEASTSRNIRILNNHVTWSAAVPDTERLGDAIGIFDLTDSVISNNTIDQKPRGQGIDNQEGEFVVIANNTIKGGAVGVELHGPGSPLPLRGNIVANNIINEVESIGIYISNNEAFIVSGNIINDPGFLAIGLRGGHPLSFNGIIDSNIILTNRDMLNVALISIYNASERIQITNNIIRATTAAANRFGIGICASAIQTRVANNTFTGLPAGRGYINFSPSTIDSQQFSELFMNVLAASAIHIHPPITPDGLVHTDVTSPDVPRNTMIRITNTDTINAQTPSGGNIVVEGADARGRTAWITPSETLVVPATSIPAGGTLDVFGSKAFATVSKVTYYSETNINIAVSVGISDRLGLSNVIYAAGDVFKVKRGTTDVPVGAVDVANGTVDCAPIVSGDDFTIYYRSNLNIYEQF